MTQTTFDDLNCDLHNAYVQTSQESMTKAGKRVYSNLFENTNSNLPQNAKVSGGGTWQKRGYSSLTGLALKNPPKKTHPKKLFLGFFKIIFYLKDSLCLVFFCDLFISENI